MPVEFLVADTSTTELLEQGRIKHFLHCLSAPELVTSLRLSPNSRSHPIDVFVWRQGEPAQSVRVALYAMDGHGVDLVQQAHQRAGCKHSLVHYIVRRGQLWVAACGATQVRFALCVADCHFEAHTAAAALGISIPGAVPASGDSTY